MAVNKCHGVKRKIPCPMSGGSVTRLPPQKKDLQHSEGCEPDVAYFWDGELADARSPGSGKKREVKGSYPSQVKGDDDFVVLFGHSEFEVWCFEKDTKLPI